MDASLSGARSAENVWFFAEPPRSPGGGKVRMILPFCRQDVNRPHHCLILAFVRRDRGAPAPFTNRHGSALVTRRAPSAIVAGRAESARPESDHTKM
jgi:hypothetical protein